MGKNVPLPVHDLVYVRRVCACEISNSLRAIIMTRTDIVEFLTELSHRLADESDYESELAEKFANSIKSLDNQNVIGRFSQ